MYWRSNASNSTGIKRVPCALQFAAQQGFTAQMRTAIKAHRDTWVSEADFEFMARLGVNAVRLPVGYWVLAQTQVRVMSFRCLSPCLSHAVHAL